MMKKHTVAQNDAIAALSRHPAEDEKVDEDESEIRSAMMPDAPQPHLNNANNIAPLSPLDVGQVNHHHHHHRPSVASASNNESRDISAQCLSSVQASPSSVPSSAPHVAASIGLAGNLHAITEATTNNSRRVSVICSIEKVLVMQPSTTKTHPQHQSESEPQDPSLSLVQPQLCSPFEATDGMTGGGGTGTITTPQTLLRSVQGPVCNGDETPNGFCTIPEIDKPRIKSPSPRTIRITKATPQTTTVARLFHILLVDDSPMSRKMLRRTLIAAGHTCDEAEDGSIAVGMVKDKGLTTYDAILMDFVMVSPPLFHPLSDLPSHHYYCAHVMSLTLVVSFQPVMDGPSATKAIRALGYIAPIIGCTGNTLDFDLARFKECGCKRVIGKPFQLELFHQYMEIFTINQRKSD